MNSNYSPINSDKSNDKIKQDLLNVNKSRDSSQVNISSNYQNEQFQIRQSDELDSLKSTKIAPFKRKKNMENEVIYSRKKSKNK